MKWMWVGLWIGGCAAGNHHLPDTSGKFPYTFEVRVPASPYAPLASALPELHKVAADLCPATYEISDRRMVTFMRSTTTIDRVHKQVVPRPYETAEIVATVTCRD
jgi:hypothetical protein